LDFKPPRIVPARLPPGATTIAAPNYTTHRDEARLLAECQAVLGYEFHNPDLLREALTHASGANHRLASNERLEFLGDAILGAVVCEMLFRKFPDYQEGELTRVKSIVVSRRTCARISEALELDLYLFLGKGMGAGDQTPSSLLADVFESLIGAIFVDGGMPAAARFITRYMEPEIEAAAEGQNGLNYKSNLQQAAQRDFGETPTYLLLDEKGPDHSKCFKIAAQIGGNRYAPAWGRNKKEAEQRAAMNALCQLSGSPIPYESD
jgi:ribonuclease-3